MMTRLADSDCPSDWGWKAVVIWSLVPLKRISSRQKLEVNTVSRSEMMDCGMPCSRTTSAKERLSHTLRRVWVCEGDEVAILAEPVDHGQDDRLASDARQRLNKV
jgi:hypothetical protein